MLQAQLSTAMLIQSISRIRLYTDWCG